MFDLAAITEAARQHGRIARLVIAEHDGSSPREVGAAMLVWAEGESGTIGGGALEWEAVRRARHRLAEGADAPVLERIPLGPGLGQCCGGAVTLLTEIFTEETLAALSAPEVIARPVAPGAIGHPPPLPVKRLLAQARNSGKIPSPTLLHGWMVEPLARPSRPLWIWGAGHVGRALVHTLSPLPDHAITWIDIARERFPDTIPPGVEPVWSQWPELLVEHAPRTARHVIVTYSHALDLELCHRLLDHGFGWLGLIGSATKRARFRSRLRQLGHKALTINRITCPIGEPALGKHPQAIAVGVAVQLLKLDDKSETEIADDNRETDSGRNTAAS